MVTPTFVEFLYGCGGDAQVGSEVKGIVADGERWDTSPFRAKAVHLVVDERGNRQTRSVVSA